MCGMWHVACVTHTTLLRDDVCMFMCACLCVHLWFVFFFFVRFVDNMSGHLVDSLQGTHAKGFNFCCCCAFLPGRRNTNVSELPVISACPPSATACPRGDTVMPW